MPTCCNLRFQSAPRSEERGDRACVGGMRGTSAFQSAPRSEERGDIYSLLSKSEALSFNPRPAPKSGAIDYFNLIRAGCAVSIRAPLRRAGRWPASRGRAACGRFNPRPAPKSGAMLRVNRPLVGVHVSIRAPLRRAGRCYECRESGNWEEFQSAPRSEERGDCSRARASCPSCSFNPRPAPKSGAIGRIARLRPGR